jgi:hypothetical protein
LESVSDPHGASGGGDVNCPLLEIMVCVTTGAGQDSFTGRLQIPDERTFRDVAAVIDSVELTLAGFGFLRPLHRREDAMGQVTPDGVGEREQRRAQRSVGAAEGIGKRKRAHAVDLQVPAGSSPPNGSQVVILSTATG